MPERIPPTPCCAAGAVPNVDAPKVELLAAGAFGIAIIIEAISADVPLPPALPPPSLKMDTTVLNPLWIALPSVLPPDDVVFFVVDAVEVPVLVPLSPLLRSDAGCD